MGLTLLIGGARSGKSSLAVEWGKRTGGPITYIATAPRPEDAPADAPADTDMAERVGRHRLERPATWTTVEETDRPRRCARPRWRTSRSSSTA